MWFTEDPYPLTRHVRTQPHTQHQSMQSQDSQRLRRLIAALTESASLKLTLVSSSKRKDFCHILFRHESNADFI